MKKTSIILTSLFLSSLLFSCNQAAVETQVETENASTAVEVSAEEEPQSPNTLTLNEGEKWAANAETTQGVNNMRALMASYEGNEKIEKFQELQDTLQSEFQLIFKRCTMTGEAHNQLHHFLIPIKESFAGLKSKNMAEAQRTYQALKQHLELYNQYFV